MFGNCFCKWETAGAIAERSLATAAGSISSNFASARAAESDDAILMALRASVSEAPVPIHNWIIFTWSAVRGCFPFGIKSSWLAGKVIRRNRSLP